MIQRDFYEDKNTSYWKEEEEDILFFKYAPQIEIDINIAKDLVRSRLEYSKGKSMYALIDFTNVKSCSKEAREYMNSPEGGLKGILGGAFLSNGVVTNVFINLFLRVNKPVVPAKFFTKKQDAINWLKELKKGQ